MATTLRRTGWIRRTVCAGLIAALMGCSTLQPVATPQQFIPTARPDRIWVTRSDNTRLLVEAPRMIGDTLAGFVGGRYQEILLPEVRALAVRQPAPRRTVLFVAGVFIVGAGVLYMLAGNGLGGGGPTTEDPSNPSSSLRYPLGRK